MKKPLSYAFGSPCPFLATISSLGVEMVQHVVFCAWLLALSMFSRALCSLFISPLTSSRQALLLSPNPCPIILCFVTVVFCLLIHEPVTLCLFPYFGCYPSSEPKYTFFLWPFNLTGSLRVGQCVHMCLGLEEAGALCLTGNCQREHHRVDLEEN